MLFFFLNLKKFIISGCKGCFRTWGNQPKMGGGWRTKVAHLNNFLSNYGTAMKFWVGRAQTMYFLAKYILYPFLPFLPLFQCFQEISVIKNDVFFLSKFWQNSDIKGKTYQKGSKSWSKVQKCQKYTLHKQKGKRYQKYLWKKVAEHGVKKMFFPKISIFRMMVLFMYFLPFFFIWGTFSKILKVFESEIFLARNFYR